MSNPNISAVINAADKATIEANINGIKALLLFLANLTPQQRQKLRKKGTKRTGYVMDVFNAVITNPSAIPTSFDVAEYVKDKNLFDDLAYVKNLLLSLVEAIDDTQMLVGSELMKQSDTAYSHLKTEAKSNLALTSTVEAIGQAFRRRARTTPATPTVPGGGTPPSPPPAPPV